VGEALFHRALKDLYGLDLSVYKEAQMQRRLLSYMKRHGLEDYPALIAYIRDHRNGMHLVDYLDINVSEFLRNPELFAFLEKRIWPILKQDGPVRKVWSAGCSNGAEPYSLAMVALEAKPARKVSIIGTDIDTAALEQARQGRYLPGDIKNVPEDRRKRYFDTAVGTGGEIEVRVRQPLKNLVSYQRHDLLGNPVGFGFSLICCRNVAIYFTEEAKAIMLKRFASALLPGGVLFTGATESYAGYADFNLRRLHSCFYQKTEGG
jgi:chemotaxis protein methyltransferase CheR